MRLIDADALMDEANSDGAYGYVDAKQISEAPTVDAIPVVHGKWIDVREKRLFGDHYFLCSNCKSRNGSMIPFNYCPNCGAKMDLES